MRAPGELNGMQLNMAASKSNYNSIVASALKGITTVKSFKDRGSVGRSLEVVNKLLQETEAVIETEPLRVLNVAQAVVEKLLPKLQYLDDSGGYIGACLEHAIGMMYQLSEKAPDGQLRKDWF